MKLSILIILLSSMLFSSNLSTLYKLYEKQEYDKGCDYAMKYFQKNKNSEKFVTFYGLTCLETDNIHRIATAMLRLTETKASRENASYFATILLQKKLLRQALLDERPLGKLTLPKTDFVLSKVFNLFVSKKYLLKDGIYSLEDSKSKNIKYQLYIEKVKKAKKIKNYMIIDIYQDGKFSKRYGYK